VIGVRDQTQALGRRHLNLKNIMALKSCDCQSPEMDGIVANEAFGNRFKG
jgi:hypothetical protein